MNDVSSLTRGSAGRPYRAAAATPTGRPPRWPHRLAAMLVLGLAACGGSGPGAEPDSVATAAPAPSAAPRAYTTVSTYAGSGEDGSIDSRSTAALAMLREPLAVATDYHGNVYVVDSFNHVIRKIMRNGRVVTVAGSGSRGAADGVGTAASFNEPRGIAVDYRGDVYVADYGNHKIRRISAGGEVSTLAGTGQAGDVDGPAATAQFRNPEGVAVSDAGVWVADTFNHKIRFISISGSVRTVAGSGTPGRADGDAATASFNAPTGIAVDSQGRVYIGDSGNHTIRRTDGSGQVSTFAGTGQVGATDGDAASASFFHPEGIAVCHDNAVYVADFDNHLIRKITPEGVVSTVAGNGSAGGTDADGPTARFNGPFGVACDAGGGDTALYVADAFNHAVRKITPTGRVSTLVGSGSAGASDGFSSSAASFAAPFGIAVSGSSDASVYVTDTFSRTLRRIGPDGAVTTLAQAGRDGNLDAGSAADSADSWSPRGVAVARDGTVFVADAMWHVIRKVSADGVVSTLAGSRNPGADDGTGTAASFSFPHGLAIDRQGTLYLSDPGNHLIRKITPAGVVTTLAGTGTQGSADGPAASASFDTPQAIALDGLDNLYVYDAGTYNLRKISAAGIVTTLAGSGEPGDADGKGVAAAFDVIGGIAADKDGTLYVGDTFNHLVRKVTPDGTVSTLAGQAKQTGSVNGALAPARFFGPAGVAIGAGGSLFVADTFNHTVRRIE